MADPKNAKIRIGGKVRPVQDSIPVLLEDEVTYADGEGPSLRSLPQKTNAVRDRMNSMLRRNQVRTSVKSRRAVSCVFAFVHKLNILRSCCHRRLSWETAGGGEEGGSRASKIAQCAVPPARTTLHSFAVRDRLITVRCIAYPRYDKRDNGGVNLLIAERQRQRAQGLIK